MYMVNAIQYQLKCHRNTYKTTTKTNDYRTLYGIMLIDKNIYVSFYFIIQELLINRKKTQ